jgi:predicted nucleotide-binding protein
VDERLKLQHDELIALRDRLDDYDEATVTVPTGLDPAGQPAGATGRNVFIVHGHDIGMREAVARCVTQLGLNPVILTEQADEGLTIIEKFEKHAGAQTGFAVVLLSPDDDCESRAAAGSIVRTKRARQNVILELGYFLGSLGRGRVRALYREGVELPSDLLGWLYTRMDERGAWRLDLGRELRAAGFDADLNRLT